MFSRSEQKAQRKLQKKMQYYAQKLASRQTLSEIPEKPDRISVKKNFKNQKYASVDAEHHGRNQGGLRQQVKSVLLDSKPSQIPGIEELDNLAKAIKAGIKAGDIIWK